MTENTRHDTMTPNAESTPLRADADLCDLVMAGADYREEREYEYLGREVAVTLRPVLDPVAIPLTAKLHEKLDMDLSEAREELEDQRDEDDGGLDVGSMDDEFVSIMQRAARFSLDNEQNGWDEKELDKLVHSTMNGLIVEIGLEALEVSGTMEEAEAFR